MDPKLAPRPDQDPEFPYRTRFRKPGIDLSDIVTKAESGYYDRRFNAVLEHGREKFQVRLSPGLAELWQVKRETKDLMGVITGVS